MSEPKNKREAELAFAFARIGKVDWDPADDEVAKRRFGLHGIDYIHFARSLMGSPSYRAQEEVIRQLADQLHAARDQGDDEIDRGGVVVRALVGALAEDLPDWTLDDYSGLALIIVRALKEQPR